MHFLYASLFLVMFDGKDNFFNENNDDNELKFIMYGRGIFYKSTKQERIHIPSINLPCN